MSAGKVKPIYRYRMVNLGYKIRYEDPYTKIKKWIPIPLRVPHRILGYRTWGGFGVTVETLCTPKAVTTADKNEYIQTHYAGLQGVRA